MAEVDLVSQLAARIERARLARGYSREELGAFLNASEATVWRWEKGLHEPRASQVRALSQWLKVSLDWLVDGAGEGPR